MISETVLYVRALNTAEIAQLETQGYSKQHVVAQLNELTISPSSTDAVLRSANPADIDALMFLERHFEDHMRSPQINAQFEVETDDEMREGFLEQLGNSDFVTILAELDGEIVGMAYACSTKYSSLHSGERRPPNSATFAKAVVSSEHRRKGIGKALATVTIQRLFELGFETIVSDWRILNTEANQTWSSLGFEPTWYRMVNE